MAAVSDEALGLCSVTLRAQSPEEVIAYAVGAGLRRVEWGADVHAPPDDPALLSGVRAQSEGAGLTICSYGSYWRAGVHPLEDLEAVVDGAVALGTDRIRIWAGGLGAAEADESDWEHTVSAIRDGAKIAADGGVGLALEFHRGTLTDSVDSTLRLVDAVGAPNLTTYWQPPLDEPTEVAVAGLRRLLPAVSAVHVFSWWPEAVRLPLSARADLWRSVLEVLEDAPGEPDLLLEFIPDDDPELLARESATLRAWVEDGNPHQHARPRKGWLVASRSRSGHAPT